MKKYLYFILLILCAGMLLISCKDTEDGSIKSPETIPTQTIIIPDVSGAELTFTDIYSSYFNPMSGDGEAGIPYVFYFKEGSTVTSDKSFGIYMSGGNTENNYKSEVLLFETGESLTLKTRETYRAFIYSDGRISAEYEPYPEPHPVATLNFYVVSEEEYKVMLEGEYKYGKNYPVSNLTGS